VSEGTDAEPVDGTSESPPGAVHDEAAPEGPGEESEGGDATAPPIGETIGGVTYRPRAPRAARLKAHRRKRRRRRAVGFTLLGLGVLILLFAGWVGLRTYQAYRHLQQAADSVSKIQSQVKSVDSLDPAQVTSWVSGLAQQAHDAHDAVHDPFVSVASHLPWIGPNLAAVTEIADTVDDLANQTMPTLVDVAELTHSSALSPHNGSIDLAPIAALAAPLQEADDAVNAGRLRMSKIDTQPLMAPIGNAVTELWRALDRASSLTATGARVGRLLPPMLGAHGPRDYLVVFQNLAEARATGGIFGSYAVVHVDDGRISIAGQGSASRTIKTFDAPVMPLPKNLIDLYSDRLTTWPADVNFTPHFPTAASVFAAMYQQRSGTAVDGVVAIDPVVISYLLQGHAPIPVGQGVSLTSENLVSVLLSTVYRMFPEGTDVPARDEFLDGATSAAFSAVMGGGTDPAKLLAGVVKGAGQHRILIWSAHPSEQADLAQTSLSSPLPATDQADGTNPHVGVFLNDGTGGKLDYYLSGSVSLAAAGCDPTGGRHLTVTTSMAYGAPDAGLPAYVLGAAEAGPYRLRTNVLVVGPTGGSVGDVTIDGRSVPVLHGSDNGRPVAVVTVDLEPGSSATVSADVVTPTPGVESGVTVRPSVVVTPGVKTWATSAPSYPACRAAS
jgi:hypothetical protein